MLHTWRLLLFAVVSLTSSIVQAETAETRIDQIIVYGRAEDRLGTAFAASEGHVGGADFSNRPLQRVGELLEVVPGLIVTQHSGAGKANQYFLRGFNLDHGTDFAGFVDGVPINLRSHGHGQGYLDLNFVIPETIAAIDYRKGPYRADVGDFATAGAALFQTYDRVARPSFTAEAGRGDYYRLAGIGSTTLGAGTVLLAGEAAFDRGRYAIDEQARKGALFGKYTAPLADGMIRSTISAYHVRFNSAEQIPDRAVASGLIGRRGSLDPDLGGRTTRVGATLGWDQDGDAPLSLLAYANLYRFQLTSNFTYLLDDPVAGDEFQQRDRRSTIGGRIAKQSALQIAGMSLEARFGGEGRIDIIPLVGLYRATAGRIRSVVREDRVTESSGAAYAELVAHPRPNVRVLLGARGDLYGFRVRSDLADNTGNSHRAILNPKASIAWQPTNWGEVYANYGQGFHSNDARGTSIRIDPVSGGAATPVDPLVRATGEEIGVRLRLARRLNLTATLWRLRLGSELLFLGDGGTTEPQGPSRRRGIELAGFWQPADWLTLDADYSRSRGRLTDLPRTSDYIPGGLETVLSAGAVVEVGSLTASLRLRHFGAVALIEDDSVRSRPTSVVNGRLAYRFGRYELAANLLNLFDVSDPEISYFYPSRLAGEPLDGIDDIHSKAVEPRQLRVSATMRF